MRKTQEINNLTWQDIWDRDMKIKHQAEEIVRLRAELATAERKLVGWPDTMRRMIEDFYEGKEATEAAGEK